MALAGDVARPEEARRSSATSSAAWDRLDILVNNAGIWEEDAAGAGIAGRLGPHVRGEPPRRLPRHRRGRPPSGPGRRRDRVRLLDRGQRGEARHSAYAASKGPIISYTKSLAAELGPRGIRVNCVAPGWVETDMTGGALSGRGPARRSNGDSRSAGREPDDVAGPVLFLVSDLARHVQGEVLNVNGGSVLAG